MVFGHSYVGKFLSAPCRAVSTRLLHLLLFFGTLAWGCEGNIDAVIGSNASAATVSATPPPRSPHRSVFSSGAEMGTGTADKQAGLVQENPVRRSARS